MKRPCIAPWSSSKQWIFQTMVAQSWRALLNMTSYFEYFSTLMEDGWSFHISRKGFDQLDQYQTKFHQILPNINKDYKIWLFLNKIFPISFKDHYFRIPLTLVLLESKVWLNVQKLFLLLFYLMNARLKPDLRVPSGIIPEYLRMSTHEIMPPSFRTFR